MFGYINVTYQEGRTAIFYAAEKGYVHIVQLMLDHGVDLELKDKVAIANVHRTATMQCFIIALLSWLSLHACLIHFRMD